MPMNEEYNTLPSSLESETLDRPGFQVSGYFDKKGTPSGENAMFNALPPGQNIDDQAVYDGVNTAFKMKQLVDPTGYDGWYHA